VQKDLGQAVQWYRRSAELGDPVAQCNLGALYFAGDGVHRDDREAAHWFKAAAEQGLAVAQDNLALMYSNGRGVPLDYQQAAAWARAAAEQGYAQAQSDLGYLYEQGTGVPLNYITAYTWYHLAVAGGDRRAASRMKKLSSIMTHEQIRAAGEIVDRPARPATNAQPETSSYVEHTASPLKPMGDPSALTRPWPGPFSE
jgi:hypothetical protein